MQVLDKNQLIRLLSDAYCKSTVVAIANQASIHKKIMKSLVEIITGKDALMAQRASWAIASLEGEQVNTLQPYTSVLLETIQKPVHDAVIRNIIRAWQTMVIPEKYVSLVYDACLNFACNPQMAVAIRAFSITVCGRICQVYPELADEFMALVPIWDQDKSPAIAMRLRDAKKKFKKYFPEH